MLKELRIANYALIDEIEIHFAKNLNVITGETGAGKSILLGALELVLGKRADTSVLFNKDKKCVVEAVFVTKNESIKTFLVENELDLDTNIIIRREIANNGKSRAFINDTPVTLNQLSELSGKLIDIHSQYHSLQLNDHTFQMNILDAVAKNTSLVNNYQVLYKKLRYLDKKIEELTEKEKKSQKDQDYFLYQLNEITNLQLIPEQDTLLEEELLTLSNAEKIKENIEKSLHDLDENEFSVLQIMKGIRKAIQDISKFNPRIEGYLSRIEQVETDLKDLIPEMLSFLDHIEIDGKRLNEITERLDEINRLLAKHQLSGIYELIELKKSLQAKINSLFSVKKEIQDLRSEYEIVETKLKEYAVELHMLRTEITPKVEKLLIDLLSMVGMKNSKIHFSVMTDNNHQFMPNGTDHIDIMFSSNPGIDMQSVSKVASGGELSRLMLCIKYILAGSVLLPTIIFDEIDLGISGEISFKVGKLLSEMSLKHQIIAITHLPQVASFGKEHFKVYKTADSHETHTYIKKLKLEERIEELAKMIGGEHPNPHAVENAKELIKNSL